MAAVVYAHPSSSSSEGSSEGSSEDFDLAHFDKTALDSDMLEFKFPADLECMGEGTLGKANSCVKRVHDHAKQCIGMMHADQATHDTIVSCETENAEVKAADQAWQEASQKYHVQMGNCLRGEEPEDDEVFYFRRKRHSKHAHAHPSSESYDSVGDCWKAMKGHKTACMQTMGKCPRIALCGGMLPEEPAEDVEWHNIMKDLVNDKEQKVRDHKQKLHACLGSEVHWHMEAEPEGEEPDTF